MPSWLKPDTGIITAPVWHVCFVNSPGHWWECFLTPGFRHVFMLGYLPACDAWLFYDVGFSGTTIAILSGDEAGGLLQRGLDEGGVLCVKGENRMRPFWQRIGFWCVPAALHLLGVRCVAVTPKGLHDRLLKLGAKPFPESANEPVQRQRPEGRQGHQASPASATGAC